MGARKDVTRTKRTAMIRVDGKIADHFKRQWAHRFGGKINAVLSAHVELARDSGEVIIASQAIKVELARLRAINPALPFGVLAVLIEQEASDGKDT